MLPQKHGHAETPGEWVSLSDIRARGSAEQQANWPRQRFGAGALAGLTRRIRLNFGRNNWPMDYDYREGGDSRSFRMADDIAAWWRAARTRHGADGGPADRAAPGTDPTAKE